MLRRAGNANVKDTVTTPYAAGTITPVLFSLLRTTAAFQLPGRSEADQERETLTYIRQCWGRPYRASDPATVWGTVPHVGNVAQPPLGKASGERGWRTGPTSMYRFSSGKLGLYCTYTAMTLALAKTPSPWGSKCLLSIFIFPKSGVDLPGMEHSHFDHFSFYIANILLWCIQWCPLLCLQKITTQNKPMHNKWGPSLM